MSDIYQYYNANPRDDKISDCVRRSISLAYHKDYKQVTRELRTLRKNTNEKLSNVPIVFEAYIHQNGCVYESESIVKSKEQTIKQFIKSNPIGTYLLIVGRERGNPKHMTPLIDGVIYDTFDCTDWYIIKYYKVR